MQWTVVDRLRSNDYTLLFYLSKGYRRRSPTELIFPMENYPPYSVRSTPKLKRLRNLRFLRLVASPTQQVYSDLKPVAGLVIAALIAWKLTVKKAIINPVTAAATNTHHCISMR